MSYKLFLYSCIEPVKHLSQDLLWPCNACFLLTTRSLSLTRRSPVPSPGVTGQAAGGYNYGTARALRTPGEFSLNRQR